VFIVELLVEDAGFRNGWWCGLVATVGALVVAVACRRWRPTARAVPVAALAAVAATLVALDRTGPSVLSSDALVRGIVVVTLVPAVGAAVTGLLGYERWGPAVALVAAVPGAVILGGAAGPNNALWWIPAFTVGATLIGGTLLVDYDTANTGSGLAPILLAMTALGAWTTVPDTEQILVVAGVFLPIALLGLPVTRITEGAGAYGVVGLLVWVATVGGRGRPGAVIGAVACLGILLAEPIARRIWRGRAVTPRHAATARGIGALVVHAGVVLLAARFAGFVQPADTAVGLSAVVLLLGVAAMVLVLRPRRPGDPPREASRPLDRPRSMDGA
jgi:hypothetical protein